MIPAHRSNSFVGGARAAIPLAFAVGAFGVSFGLLARSAGMGTVAPIVMSATTFGGSAQFAAASVYGAGGGVAAAVLAAVLLNARYAPIGVSIAPHFHGPASRRFLAGQMLVDESWAIALQDDRGFELRRMLGAGLLLYAAWIGGTVLGVLGGDALGDPSALGLDAAFPALFLALLVPQLGDRRRLAAAALSAGIALVLIPYVSSGVPIIAASLACLLGWRRG
jgi:branched chain amino acid efflux pump